MAKLELVEDPDILAQFEDPAPAPRLEPVEDPDILAQFDDPVEPAPVPRGTTVEQPVDDKRKRQQLRAVSFQMLNDANRLSPRLQRDVADESSGVVGGTLRGGKRVLGGVAEVLGELISNPFSRTEAQTLNQAFGEGEAGKISEDLRAARDAVGWDAPQGKERGREVIDNFITHFENNGVTDGKEMMTLLKDSIRENVWDPTTDDTARVLSDGDVRVNPKFVALPDANEGISAINATSASPEAKEEAIANFKAGRKIAAKMFDEKTRGYEEDYRKHAEAKAAAGVTDPEAVFFSWPGLNRGFIADKWDVVRDTVAEAGRATMQTVRSLGMGLAEATGDTEDVERIGRDMLASSAKSRFVGELAAARGQQGPISGTGKELGTTVLQMAPMFAGAKLGRIIAGGTEANAARKMLGKATAATSVYGYAGMQGYGSLMQTALEKAETEAAAQGRELTAEEIDSTVDEFQGAALANGFQTMLLSVLLSGGAERAAMQGLSSQAGQMSGREVLAAFRQNRGAGADIRQALTAAKPEMVKFAKEAYAAGKVGFKDEAIEESANQFLEGVITKLSGADADKTWDQIGQETWKGGWMGGVIGGGLPVAMKTISGRDPVVVEAQRMAAEAALNGAPESAAEAAKDITATPDTDESATQADPVVGEQAATPAAELPPPDAGTVAPGESGAPVSGVPVQGAPVGETPEQRKRREDREYVEANLPPPPVETPSPAPVAEAGTPVAAVAGETPTPNLGETRSTLGDEQQSERERSAAALIYDLRSPETGNALDLDDIEMALDNADRAASRGREIDWSRDTTWLPNLPTASVGVAKDLLSTPEGRQAVRKIVEARRADEQQTPPLESAAAPETQPAGVAGEPVVPAAAPEAGVAAEADTAVGDAAVVTEESDADKFARIRAMPGSQRTQEDIDWANGYTRAKAQAEKAKEEAEQAEKDAPVTEFLESTGWPAMRKTRAKTALEGTAMNRGEVKTFRKIVEELVAKGAVVTSHPKFGMVLKTPDGGIIEQRRITKTGLDYASWLISKRDSAAQAQTATPSKPLKVGNTEAIPTPEESARWDAAEAYNRSFIGNLEDEALDDFGDKVGVKRQGVGDVAFREKILQNTHPDDILDAIPDPQAQTTPVQGQTETPQPVGAEAAAPVQGQTEAPAEPTAPTGQSDPGVAEDAPDATPEQLQEQAKVTDEPLVDDSGTVPPPSVTPDPAPATGIPEGAIGLMHEATDADRARLGLPPRLPAPPYTDQQAWDDALATVAENPDAGSQLLARLMSKPPRALTKEEHALLLHEKRRRQQDADRKWRYLNSLPDSAEPGERLDASHAAETAQDLFSTLIIYAEAAGSASGLSLQARKMLVSQDYSDTAVIAYLRGKANKFSLKPVNLTHQEMREAVKLAAELREAQARVDALEASNESKDAALAEQAALIERLTVDVERAQGKATARDPKEKGKIRKALEAKVAEAKARLAEQGLVKPDSPDILFQSGPTPDQVKQLARNISDVATVMAGVLVDRALTPVDFLTAAVRTFGTWVTEHIDAIRARSEQLYNETANTVRGKAAPTPTELLDGLDGTEPVTRKDVWDLARAYVIAGVRGNNILTSVHEALSAKYPDLTRERVATLFTDYGRVSYPSKDATSIELNRARNLERIALKILDLKAGVPPKRTGFQRGEQDPEIRALEKEFRALLKESGIQITDPERQLKSALGAAKRRMENEIEELQLAIDRGERRTDSARAPVPFDEEALDLKSRLEAKRQEYAAAFPVDKTLTPEKRAELAVKALDRQIAEEEKMIADGVLKRPKGTPFPDTPEMAARRRKLADLRQTRRDLYEAQNPGQTALEQAKAAAVRSIERLEAMLKSGEVAVKKREAINPDAELAALWDARDALSDEVTELRKALPISPEKEAADIRRALEASQKTLAKLEGRIARGDILVVPKVSTPASRDAAVQGVRARIKELNKELARMRREAKPKMDPEEARIHRYLGSVKKRREELERRMREGDFDPSAKKKPVPVNTVATRDADFEFAKVKERYTQLQMEYMLKNASFLKKLGYNIRGISNLSKVVTLGGDFGMPFRNLSEATAYAIGNDLAMLVPGKFGAKERRNGSMLAKMVKEALEAFPSAKAANEQYERIIKRPTAGYDKAFGMVFVSPMESGRTSTEDIPQANLIEKIPWWVWPIIAGVKISLIASNPVIATAVGLSTTKIAAILGTSLVQKRLMIALDRGQRAITNKYRALLIDNFIASMPGETIPTEDGVALGKAVMIATGRGSAKSLEHLMPAFQTFFLATRFYLSRIQSLSLYALWSDAGSKNKMSTDARLQIAGMAGKVATGRSVLVMMLIMAFGKADDDDPEDAGVVLNPKSKDFGKVRVTKDILLDPMGGLSQFAQAFRQAATGAVMVNDPDSPDYGRMKAFTPAEKSRALGSFILSKKSLLVGYLWNSWAGEYFGGKPATLVTALDEITSMIILNDAVKLVEETDPSTAAFVFSAMYLGAGGQIGNYDDKKEKWAELREIMEEKRQAKEERLNEE